MGSPRWRNRPSASMERPLRDRRSSSASASGAVTGRSYPRGRPRAAALRRPEGTGRQGRVSAEPQVRIRCTPEDEARARTSLARAGLEAERVLTWLVVRDAEPDQVNEALVAGGATVRTVVRERIGHLVGWLLDRQGALDGRGVNVQTLVR